MSSGWITVKVFISSTFKDMQAERDHLVRFVFPKLREELVGHRIHLVDVDLRWGVMSDQDALGVCRDVIDECHPRFMCILGGRYGWVPEGKDKSITADEVHYGVLDREAAKRGHAFFYFRDEKATADMAEEVAGEYREADGSENGGKLAALKRSIKDAGLPVVEYHAEWSKAQMRLIGLEAFGERVRADLLQSLRADPTLADQFTGDGTAALDEFADEAAQMEAFIEERTERYVVGSRDAVLKQMRDFAAGGGTSSIFVLIGEHGSGKSALLAKFCRSLPVSFSPSLLVSHFVGASTGSTDLRRTLRRLCHELAKAAGNGEPLPLDIKELITHFQKLLSEATAKQRVLLVFDALNQFDETDGALWMNWMPRDLPPGVRIIASVIAPVEGEKEHQTLAILRNRKDAQVEALKPLDESDTEAIIEGYLKRYSKRLSPEQIAALKDKPASNLPLYVLTALEELRTLGTYEEITDRIRTLPGDARALFGWILTERLARDPGFRDREGRPCGAALVIQLAACLGVSRHGLSPAELTALLDPGDPLGNVAALLRLLRPYLMRRGELLDFYHGQFREAVEMDYLQADSERHRAHKQLAEYFRGMADPEGSQSWSGISLRPFQEIAFHQIGARQWDDVCAYLTDFRCLDRRIRAGQVFDLVNDQSAAIATLPEFAEEARHIRKSIEVCARYGAALITYARDCAVGKMPALPVPPSSVRPEVARELPEERSPRAKQLRIFASFAANHASFLSACPEAFLPFAANHAEDGPLIEAGDVLTARANSWIARSPRPPAPPLRPKCVRILQGHTSGVAAVSMTPDCRRAVSSSYDHTLRVWDLDSGQCIHTLLGHTNWVMSVSVTPDGLRAVSCSLDGTLRVWDLEAGHCLTTYQSDVLSVIVTPDGRRVFSATRNDMVVVLDLGSGRFVSFLHGPSAEVSITPDGRSAVSGGGYGPHNVGLRLWNVDSGQSVQTLPEHTVSCVSITPDVSRVVCGSFDTLRVWDLSNGQCLHALQRHNRLITSVSVTPDGRRAVSAGVDESVRVWDLDTGQCLGVLDGHTSDVNSVSVSPDGRHAVSGGNDGTVRFWNLQFGQCLPTLEKHTGRVTSVNVTSDGRRVISGSSDNTFRLWDLYSGLFLRKLVENTDDADSLSVTSDGLHAVSGSSKYAGIYIRVWDLNSGQCLNSVNGKGASIACISLTPDGRHAVSGSGTILRLWDLASGECLRSLEGHTYWVTSVSVSPDGRYAVSGSDDKTLRLWDLCSGEGLRIFHGHADAVKSVCVSPDGRSVVSGAGGWGGDKTLRQWDIESGKCLHIFQGHTNSVIKVIVAPDGRHAISGSSDHTLRVWDLDSGLCLAIYHADTAVCSVAVSPTGDRIVCGTADGQMHFLTLHNIVSRPQTDWHYRPASSDYPSYRAQKMDGQFEGSDSCSREPWYVVIKEPPNGNPMMDWDFECRHCGNRQGLQRDAPTACPNCGYTGKPGAGDDS